MRRTTKAALTIAAAVSIATTLAGVAAGPASAKPYPPPSIHLSCSAAANDGTLEGTVCVLPPGMTTAPNAYSATIAVSKAGHAGATVTFALTAGSLPPGLTMPAQGGSGTVITGNPTNTGTFSFTIKATDGNLTATQAYQITITGQGPPDQLLCTVANGSFGVSEGGCTLPDALAGQPYQGHLVTSHQAGGTLRITAGALPPGLSLPASFGPSGDIISGIPSQQDEGNDYSFTVQGTGDQGQPLYEVYDITVDPNVPLTVVLPAVGSTLEPAMVGGAYAQNFFLNGGASPFTWAVTAGQLPPGLTLQTSAGPGDANNELAGTATTAGTYTFTMRVSDYDGQQATQQFTLIVDPPLQITTTLPAGTVGVAYSHDLIAQGGTPPYSWFVADTISELPPGLTLDTTAPDFNNVLTGTPAKAGTFSFPMQVQDSQDNMVSATMTITIKP